MGRKSKPDIEEVKEEPQAKMKETESTGFSFADALKGGQKKADNVEPKVASPRADKVEADRNIAAGEMKVELADLIVKAEQANPEDNSNKSKKNKKKEKTKTAEKTVEAVKEEPVPAPENAKKKKNKNKNGTVGTEKISETVPEEPKDVKLTEETPKSKKNKKKEEKKPDVKEDPKPAETSDTKETTSVKGEPKRKNKKSKSKNKSELQDNLPDPALGSASGISGKDAMQEVDDLLDQWFKGGKESIDDDVPDDLPDIVQVPKPTLKKEPKKKEKESKKGKEAKEPKKEAAPKKEIKKEKKSEPKKDTNLSEVDNILDEWFKDDGIDNDDNDDVPDDLPDIIEMPKVSPKKKKEKKAAASKPTVVVPEPESRFEEIVDDDEEPADDNNNDLDEVNDILDEWFANEEDEEDANADDGKITELGEQEEPVELRPQPLKPEVIPDPVQKDAVPMGDCLVCGRLTKVLCSGCRNVFYCRRECQAKDWSTHKENCKEFAKLPYRVERSPILGRFLSATKDLPAGELILQESPMVVGPRQLTKPVCLGCHKEIESASEMIKCVRCNWPVCSRKCMDSPLHVAECRATKAAGGRINVEVFGQTNMMYACITILRALALQDGPKKIWEDYTKFDSHLDQRIKTQIYSKVNKEKVVFFIHHYLGIKRYSDLEILEACGKLDTNCFEIRQDGKNLRAMYRTACIISHACSPNTRHTFSPDHSINIYTTQNIKKGSVISATYTNLLWPTTQRREHLNISKCFWCSCARCRDPSELDSYLSAMRCMRCKGFSDNIQSDDLQYLTPVNPLDLESVWRCGKCTNIQRADQIKAGNEKVVAALQQANRSSVEELLSFLHYHEPLLGPNNHHVVEVKYTIVSILGNRASYPLEELSMQLLTIKERFCRELLQLSEHIDPGLSRWRGQLLLELQMAIVALAAGQAEGGMITKAVAREKAEEGLAVVREATSILQVEPDMLEILQERMKAVSDLLSQWEE